MVIYNPFIGGRRIVSGDTVIDLGQRITTEDKEIIEELFSQFPFLVNLSEYKYSPSYAEIKNKTIWGCSPNLTLPPKKTKHAKQKNTNKQKRTGSQRHQKLNRTSIPLPAFPFSPLKLLSFPFVSLYLSFTLPLPSFFLSALSFPSLYPPFPSTSLPSLSFPVS